MTVLKRNVFQSIAAKKTHSTVSKGVKRLTNFARGQLKHPAVANFIQDQVGIAAVSGFNPEVAAPAMAARTAQEGVNIAERTARHYMHGMGH